MSDPGLPSKGQREELRLSEEYVARWLRAHGITWQQIEDGAEVWQGPSGEPLALTLSEVEDLIAAENPVCWAWLNLVEKKSLRIDGELAVEQGQPWALFVVQAKMARIRGDLIVECGAEVGKTRDIVLQILWRADTEPGSTAMVGGDSDQTLIPIWEELEYQLELNSRIGGGVVEEKCHIKPNRKKVFRNGAEIELRLAGHDGKNFRGGHFSYIYADEAAKWKNRQQWSEFFRSGLPGSVARIYSTPDGDYSSPFAAMCFRAISDDGSAPATSRAEGSSSADGERRFRKFHISKRELPPPFWTPRRAAILREQFGGEHTVGWITNVEGGWGSPSYSVFPMPTLEPCLKAIPEYRLVVVMIDKRHRRASLTAAKLTLEADGGEDVIARDTFDVDVRPDIAGRDIGKRIAEFFPDVRQWVTPKIFAGADLGSAQDPTEVIFDRVVGRRWIDLFRLHLRGAEWEEQSEIFMQLDHASGHRAIFSLDNGSAGSVLVADLTKAERRRSCPECAEILNLEERISGRGFGEAQDEIDVETGEPMCNPDDVDAAGNPRPYRLLNKEFSTRVLERKVAAQELEIALDAGAGDQRLSGPQLMVNHTASGINRKGERSFRAVDDHYVDAKRQVALAVTAELREGNGSRSPDPDEVSSLGIRRGSYMGGVESVRAEYAGERLDIPWEP